MIGYKVAKSGEKRVIITLEIPEDALTNMSRSNVAVKETAKYRTNKAKVLKIEDPDGKQYDSATSAFWDTSLLYKMGDMIVCEDFNKNLEEVCSSGIHFFLDRKVVEHFDLNADLDGFSDGIITSYHDNGQKDNDIPYINGKKHGLVQGWYDNGQINAEFTYVNDLQHGMDTTWYPNGQKKDEENYKNGKKDGVFRRWYPSGQLFYEGKYKDGKEDGEYTSWHLNGKKRSEGTFNNGQIDGIYRKWDESGNILEFAYYVNGIKENLHILETFK